MYRQSVFPEDAIIEYIAAKSVEAAAIADELRSRLDQADKQVTESKGNPEAITKMAEAERSLESISRQLRTERPNNYFRRLEEASQSADAVLKWFRDQYAAV